MITKTQRDWSLLLGREIVRTIAQAQKVQKRCAIEFDGVRFGVVEPDGRVHLRITKGGNVHEAV